MEFTPFTALAGGSLIGISSALMFYLFGRITGISGFLSQGMQFKANQWWRWIFLVGVVIGGSFGMRLTGMEPTNFASNPMLVAGGLLVGIGTRLSNGCTSGHGVCGNARLSPRSMVATVTFIGVGMLTAYALTGGAFA